jgi:peroxisomal enoyl-CoA hydratase 2
VQLQPPRRSSLCKLLSSQVIAQTNKCQANAIGVKADERHFLYELHPRFAAFPTFPSNLAFKQTDQDVFDFVSRTTTANVPGVPPFDAQRSVDGERGIEILKQLPTSSDGLDLEVQSRVIGVYDKGRSRNYDVRILAYC